jgi:CRISPR-associated endonuclease/helicase Cas3
MQILADIKQRLLDNEPVICVSTQLIEAGVDIDFGSVIRYLAVKGDELYLVECDMIK